MAKLALDRAKYQSYERMINCFRFSSQKMGLHIMKMMRKITKNKIFDDNHIFCPVCGAIVEKVAVCQNCNWENNGLIEIDGCPNEMTLEEARKAYEEAYQIK